MVSVLCTRGISFAAFLVGFALFLAGFSSTMWVHYDHENGRMFHEGIWVTCLSLDIGYSCATLDPFYTPSQIKATQAFMCFAMILLILDLGAFIYWLTIKPYYIKRNGITDAGRVALYTCGGAGCFNLMAILIYGFHALHIGHANKLNWSFALSVISAVIFIINGFLSACIADVKPETATGPGHHYPSSHPGTQQVVQYPNNVQFGQMPGQMSGQMSGQMPGQMSGQMPVYFVAQNNSGALNVVYQPGYGYDPNQITSTMNPPYTPTTPTTGASPPAYQEEWYAKGSEAHAQAGASESGGHSSEAGAMQGVIAAGSQQNTVSESNQQGTDNPGFTVK